MEHGASRGKTTNQPIIAFIATLFAMLTLQMSSLGFSPLLPAIQKEFEMSYSQIGLFTGMYGLLAIAMSVPAGMLAKRFGERNVLSIGMAIVALGLFLLSEAPNFGTAFGGRLIWLIGYRLAFVCIVTTIAVSSPPSLKSSSMGVLGATGALASVIGAPFGSKIGDQFGWRHGIIAFGAMAILGGLIFWFFYRRGRNANVPIEGRTYGNSRTTAQPPMPETRSAFRTPIVWALALLLGLCGVGQFSMTFFVPSAASTIFKLGAVDAAYIISTGYIAAIFANLLFGYLMDRFNKWKIMSALMTAFILSCLAMTPENLNLFRTATALMLALGFSATNQVYAIAGQVLSGRETGNVMGVVSLGAGIFGYVGPRMLGVLRDWTGGFTAGWLAMAGLAALALIEIIVLSGYGGEKRRLWKKGEAGAQP